MGRKISSSYVVRGFTMIELLIAVTLFAVVAAVIYSSLSVAIQTWKRGEVEGNFIQRMRVTTQKLQADLTRVIAYEGIRFVGDAQQLYFSGVTTLEEPKGVWAPQVAKIRYRKEQKESAICLYREVLTVAQSLKEDEGEFKPKPAEMLYPLKDVTFEYAVPRLVEPDLGTEVTFSWEDTWKGEHGIPLGVRMAFTFEDQAGVHDVTFVKTVFLPVGRKEAVPEEYEGGDTGQVPDL